ncbi:MAG: hypothetical protein JWM80_2154 [Cyanobacteria bacterium RYN_339]|nr:hypothetical protein [Cyanobacteria bacterium RYN_339]
MTAARLAHPLLATSLALALLAGCQPAPSSAPPAPTPEPTAAPTTPPTSATAPLGTAVGGAAGIQGQPFAGADVKVFRLGQKDSLAVGKTDDTGHFIVDLGLGTPAGVPLKVIATKGNQVLASIVASGAGNIVAQGAGNIVAQGGGNIVAQGGGNIVAQGGGNIVAQGGGNIVAQGGGNIVAQGGGNVVGNSGGTLIAQGGGHSHLLEAGDNPAGLTRLNVASTTAVAILSTRLEAYGQVSQNGAQGTGEDVLVVLRGLTTELFNHETDIIAKTGLDSLLQSLDAFGQGNVNKQTGDALLAAADGLAAKIEDFVKSLDVTISKTSEQTGVKADSDKVGDLTLGSQTFGSVEAHAAAPATDPTTPTNNNPNGSSGPAGSNGATIEAPPATTTASGVTVGGNFDTSAFDPTGAATNTTPSGSSYSAFFTSPTVSMARRDHAAVVLGTKLYILGGKDSAGTELNTVLAADVNLNTGTVGTFTQVGTLPSAISGATAVAAGGKILMFGGESGGAPLPSFLDIAVTPAGQLGVINQPVLLPAEVTAFRRSHAAAAYDAATNTLFLAGGKGAGGTPLHTAVQVSVGTNLSTPLADLPVDLVDGAGLLTTAFGPVRFFVSGGTVGGTPQDKVYAIDPKMLGSTFSALPERLLQARYGHTMFNLGTELFVLGGHGTSGSLQTGETAIPNFSGSFQLSRPGLASAREGFSTTPLQSGVVTRLLVLGGQRDGTVVSTGDITRLFPVP